MKKIIKLTESDLSQLIKKIIREQKETDYEFRWIQRVIKKNPGYLNDVLIKISPTEVRDIQEEYNLTMNQAFELIFSPKFSLIAKTEKFRSRIELYIQSHLENHIERSIYNRWVKIHNL